MIRRKNDLATEVSKPFKKIYIKLNGDRIDAYSTIHFSILRVSEAKIDTYLEKSASVCLKRKCIMLFLICLIASSAVPSNLNSITYMICQSDKQGQYALHLYDILP